MALEFHHPTAEVFLPPKEEELVLTPDRPEIFPKRDALIVLSGGMDSTTMLYEYAPHIALAVTFIYGSNHNDREAACAEWHCRRLGIEHLVIPLGFMADHFKSCLLYTSPSPRDRG